MGGVGDDRRLVIQRLLPRGRRVAPARGPRGARRPRDRRPARPQVGRRRAAPRRRRRRPRHGPAAAGLPAAAPHPPAARDDRRADRRSVRQPAEDHAGHDRRPRRRRGRRRDPGPGDQGGPVAAGRVEHPRPVHAERRRPSGAEPATRRRLAERGRGEPRASAGAAASRPMRRARVDEARARRLRRRTALPPCGLELGHVFGRRVRVGGADEGRTPRSADADASDERASRASAVRQSLGPCRGCGSSRRTARPGGTDRSPRPSS